MKIIAVTSGKGGVGKSTLSLNIARQLSLSGKRTLLVDFDIHNKGATNLFLPKVLDTTVSITEIVAASKGFSHTLSPTFIEQLLLIPLTTDGKLLFLPAARPTEMMNWQHFVATNEAMVTFFKETLHSIAKQNNLDVIVIDCYGGIDSLTVAAAGIADDMLIVNEPDVITFGGTLTLYTYLLKQYEVFEPKPRLHFVINRISSRHSFKFLNEEYKKNLAPLSIDKGILGYFPYDKLLMDTFGDYPFFSEILPDGLFTLKLRLLIETLWEADGYSNLSRLSARQRKHVFQRTSENGFAEPDVILRAFVTLPFYLVVPILLFTALYWGIGHSLDYRTITAVIYTASALLICLVFLIGVFEPFQMCRWLLREARYRRRKRNLQKKQSAVYRATKTATQFALVYLPALVSVGVLLSMVYGLELGKHDIWNDSGNLKLIQLWPGTITGLHQGGDYSGISLNSRAVIRPGTDLSNANFSYANLNGVRLDGLILRSVWFNSSQLGSVKFYNSDLSGANFSQAYLGGATFEGPKLRLSTGDLKANFTYAQTLDWHPETLARLAAGGAILPPKYTPSNDDSALEDLKDAVANLGKESGLLYLAELALLYDNPAGPVLAKFLIDDLDRASKKHDVRSLLALLFLVVTNQPHEQATQEWCVLLHRPHNLDGFDWDAWDSNLDEQKFSPESLRELQRIEKSAKGEIGADEFCGSARVRPGAKSAQQTLK